MVAYPPAPDPLDSTLYCRFNGFSLGAFVAGAQLPLASTRYPALRRRILEFFEEADIAQRLPAAHAAYVAGFPALMPQLQSALRSRSPPLHEAFGIGAMAVLHASSHALADAALKRRLRERWIPVLERHGVPAAAYHRFVRGVAGDTPTRDAVALFTHAYTLLDDFIKPLGGDAHACFVAMPFRRPYAGWFGRWYRPALRQAGFHAIRAWGGLSDEEYYPFVGALMARCAAVLADLSTLNLNVVNEVGLAHGANRPTFLVMRADARRPPPSNLAKLLILRYDPQVPGWPENDVPRLARYVRHLWRDQQRQVRVVGLVQTSAQTLVRYLELLGHEVPLPLADLAAPALQPPAAPQASKTNPRGTALRPEEPPPKTPRARPGRTSGH